MTNQLLQMGFMVLGGLASTIFLRMAKDLDRLVSSVEALNTKIAVVIERLDQHEHRINKLEERK